MGAPAQATNVAKNLIKQKIKKKIVMWVLSLFCTSTTGMMLGGGAVTAGAAEEAVHSLEQHVAQTLLKSAACRLAGATGAFCNPTKSFRENFNNYRKQTMEKLRQRFSTEKPTVQENWDGSADQVAVEDGQGAADLSRAPPQSLIADQQASGYDGDPKVTADTAPEAGTTTATEVPSTVEDVQLATDGVTEADVIGDVLATSSKTASVGDALLSTAGTIVELAKGLVSRSNLIGFAAVAAWQVYQWSNGIKDRRNLGAMYWTADHTWTDTLGGTFPGTDGGNDTNWAIDNCRMDDYMSAIDNPRAMIGLDLYWNWRPSMGAPAGIPQLHDFSGFNGKSLANYSPIGYAELSHCVSEQANGYLHNLPKTSQALIADFAGGMHHSLTESIAHASTLSLSDLKWVGKTTPVLDMSLNSVKDVPGLTSLVSMGGFPSANVSDRGKSLGDAQNDVQLTQQKIADIMSKQQSSAISKVGSFITNVGVNDASDKALNEYRGQLKDREKLQSDIEYWMPSGSDVAATALRSHGTAYHQMIDAMRNGQGQQQWDMMAQLARSSPHKDSRDTINAALAQAAKECKCNFEASTGRTGNPASNTVVLGNDSTDSSMLDANTTSMLMALTDVIGHNSENDIPSSQGNVGETGMLPSQFAKNFAGAGGGTTDTGASDQYLATGEALAADLKAHNGDVVGAFGDYVRDNRLAPFNGAWKSDANKPQDGYWGSAIQFEGKKVQIPTAVLLGEVASQYKLMIDNPRLDDPSLNGQPGANTAAWTLHGMAMPPLALQPLFEEASKKYGIPKALLYTLAAAENNFRTDNVCSSQLNTGDSSRPADSPDAFGMMQEQPRFFISNGQGASLPSDAFTPTPMQHACPNWGEPQGELNPQYELDAAAWFLKGQGVTMQSTPQQMMAAIFHYNAGPARNYDPQSAAGISRDVAQGLVSLPIYQAWIDAGQPAPTAPSYTGPIPAGYTCCTSTVPIAKLFPWVPNGGYQSNLYPFGQCTWWARYNTASSDNAMGNGGAWYASAVNKHYATAPPSTLPPPGSTVSWSGSGPYDKATGHVAVVTSDDANSKGYWVSEMNYVKLGVVDVRHVSFPDPYLQGSILPPPS